MRNNNNNNNNNNAEEWQMLNNIYSNIRAGRSLNKWNNFDLLLYLVYHPFPAMRAVRNIYVKNNTGKYVRTNKPNKPINRKRILKNIKKFG